MSEVVPELTYEGLKEAFESRVRKSTTRGRDGIDASKIHPDRQERLIRSAADAIRDNTYEFGAYREFLKPRGAQKPPRVLSVPGARDRTVLAAINNHLVAQIAELSFARPQPLIARVRNQLRDDRFHDFVRLDVQAFYHSLDHAHVLGTLRTRGIKDEVVTLVERVLQTPTVPLGAPAHAASPTMGVPVGTTIANTLGEVALLRLDHEMASDSSIAYFRYVDDVLLLTRHGDRRRARGRVHALLEEAGLRAHVVGAKAGAGKLARESFDYLGYRFTAGAVTVDRPRTHRLINGLSQPLTALKRFDLTRPETNRIDAIHRAAWWFNLRITGCLLDGSRRGWLAYYSQISDVGLLHHLDHVAQSLVQRLPGELRFKSKSFVRAFGRIHRPSRDKDGYVPDFDKPVSEDRMHWVLRVVAQYSWIEREPTKLKAQYERFLHHAAVELERDVGATS